MEEKIKVKALEKENLTRGLKPRHMWMMAIGSAIGTGLFYGSAGAIKLAGPSAIVFHRTGTGGNVCCRTCIRWSRCLR